MQKTIIKNTWSSTRLQVRQSVVRFSTIHGVFLLSGYFYCCCLYYLQRGFVRANVINTVNEHALL